MRLIKFIVGCFLIALFLHTLNVVQMELLTRAYVAGFKQSQMQCLRPQNYQKDYEGGT